MIIKEELIKNMTDLKAVENNTIDLDAYSLGLSEMYDAMNVAIEKDNSTSTAPNDFYLGKSSKH